VNLQGAYMDGGANLSNVNFTNAILNSVQLDGAVLSSVNFTGASLYNSNLSGADLSNNATLANDSLMSAHLNGAILTNANLDHADLRYADLTNSTLTNVNLNYTRLPSAMPILPVIAGVTVVVDAPLAVAGATTVASTGSLLIEASGQLNTSSLLLDPNGTLTFTLAGLVGGSNYGQINVANGPLTLTGTLDVLFSGGFDPALGDTFDLLNGSLTGQFGSVNLPELDTGLAWDTSQLNTNGVLSVAQTPEPGTGVLYAAGGFLLTLAARRRRK